MMGFAMGSTCFSQSPLYVSRFSFSSVPSCSCSSQSNSLPLRNVEAKQRSGVPAALRSKDYSNDDGLCKRRAILFLGISVFPILQFKAQALDGSGTEKTDVKAQEGNQIVEQAAQIEKPPNPFASILNVIGVFGSGVLGSLYAVAQKEKMAAELTIESISTKLKEKESSIISMRRSYDSKLQSEQEEHTKQLSKAKEEQTSLVNQLNTANVTIGRLGQEIRNEKGKIEELNVCISNLQKDLSKAEEDKHILEAKLQESLVSIELLQERVNLLGLELKDKEDDIQKTNSSLAEKEVELKNLLSSYNQAKDELVAARSEIQSLKDELQSNKEELEMRISMVDELNANVASLVLTRDDYKRKLDDAEDEYDRLKLSSEKKASLDAKLLGERDQEIQELQENLRIAIQEVNGNQTRINDLTQERDVLKKKLELESSNAQTLKDELEVTQENLSKSRNQASDLTNQLEESKSKCTELQSEVSRLQAEYDEVRNSLQRKFEEAKQNGEILASELSETKEQLTKTNEELQKVSHELAIVIESRNGLQKELEDVYQRAETISNDLEEERKVVSSLNKEIQTLEKQNLKDKEARKSLETDLDEAIKSLDEMNRNALLLSKELEKSNSHVANLEDEKEVLRQSITDQKNATIEAQENLEDAHNLVMKLGKERDSFEKKAKKLEADLASAKGEILRLRSEMQSSKAIVNNNQQQANAEAEGKVKVTVAKKTARRRKPSTQLDKELS
ncbi:MAR-binding filament-like protein 1-1 [Cucumis melo var. makuwa]|uniref:MAR-binding filament-like protein 1-1 n=1 Tax=Cucumis melo var. makuwa TaxID=1194695 RepID=A0A5D3BYU7_CUCMM|nr:MAR-binding filament-like protein 1-1 [Cucumis melo var. makuwa]TYK04042.1 MAR-binding filament-like protein 1-1 [Cucumis melo var. makuwa]